jgi:predicted DNA-binding protein (MmcQ/YjbR family)
MVTWKELRDMAFSLPETTEEPHFEKTSFRIKGMIFATYDKANDRACVKLSEDEQSLFSSWDEKVIYPVDNSWGRKGWTFVELKKAKKEIVSKILRAAYSEVSRKKAPKPSNKSKPKKPARK